MRYQFFKLFVIALCAVNQPLIYKNNTASKFSFEVMS